MELLSIDPFVTLGVDRDASDSAIKQAYRKGCLRCHPDKTSDPEKLAEFHRIQQAFDVLGDSEKRMKYEDQLKFSKLRAELSSRRNGGSGLSSLRKDFDFRPSSGNRASPDPYFEPKVPRFEERRPPPSRQHSYREYDREPQPTSRRASEDYFSHSQARKTNTISPQRRPSGATKVSPAQSKPVPKPTERDRQLKDRQKQRDRERRERNKRSTFVVDDASSEDERDQRRRPSEFASRRGRSPEPMLSRGGAPPPSYRMERSPEPMLSRGGPPPSYRTEAFGSSRDARPEPVRRRTSSMRRDSRREETERSIPSFLKSASAGDAIKIPSRRSTEDVDPRPRSSTTSKPTLGRSQTDLPPLSSGYDSRRTTSRTKVDTTHRDTVDSGYGTQSSPDEYVSPKARSSQYKYPSYPSYEPEYDAVIREAPAPRRTTSSNANSSNPPTSSNKASASYRSMGTSSPSLSRQPSVSRSSSRQGMPTPRRSDSTPISIPMKSGSGRGDLLYGEISSSPVGDAPPMLSRRSESGNAPSIRRTPMRSGSISGYSPVRTDRRPYVKGY